MTRFSIVINTYNRATLLDDAITGLSELDYSDFEVIVINGPSTDNTEEIISKWKGKIKSGFCKEPNLSMSRNVGIEMASGEVIAFIDDDAVPHPNWLNALAPHYMDPKIGGVGGFTIDNTGVAFQVRKTVCDRFGNAFFPSDFFDERQLSVPGSPYFPSLLGTNSSFRATALREIGGFDHTFAYLLDETDVCLRLVDRGYKVIYEPSALVYHQFAPSHIRSKNKIAKTLYPSAVSKSYFIRSHGNEFSEQRANNELQKYEEEILRANKWLAEHSEITHEHRVSLDDDLLSGIKVGSQRAMQATVAEKCQQGDLLILDSHDDFLPMDRKSGLTIALVSRSFPPNQQAGIARWSWMMASGLAERGHKIHVITLASPDCFTRYENGYWIHAIEEDRTEEGLRLAAQKKIPMGISGWCIAVANQVNRLKKFGLNVVSFPIWDLEGMAIVGDDSIGVVMSLHTSYALAKPFKPEWSDRPLFEHFHVSKIIAAETAMLRNVPYILANSQAIVDDLTDSYSVNFSERALVAPHGTLDPLQGFKEAEVIPSEPLKSNTSRLKVAYVGRFEPRKGFDLACTAFAELLSNISDVEITFIGDDLDDKAIGLIKELKAELILSDDRVTFRGMITRDELDQLYIRSDVVLMPSRYESFGLVAIEAMAAGTIVIALACGGLKEVVEDGVNGFLVQPGEDAVLHITQKLMKVAKNPDLLLQMKENAREAFLKKFTVSRMIEKAEEIYFSAAKR